MFIYRVVVMLLLMARTESLHYLILYHIGLYSNGFKFSEFKSTYL